MSSPGRRPGDLLERLRLDLTRRRELMTALEPLLPDVARAARLVADVYRAAGKVLLFGNGGSFAHALHLEAELVGRIGMKRPPLSAIVLGAGQATLTALSNDFGYAQAFSRSVRALGRAGDVAIALSTSGRSENVIEAARTAREMGIGTLVLTGRDGGALAPLGDVTIRVPFDDTPLIQEAHQVLVHLLATAVESELFPDTLQAK